MAFNVLRQRELDVDDPRTTQLWKQIVKRKGFLNSIYEEWYSEIKAWLPTDGGAVLELGSGAGFLRERIPDLVTSDILHGPGLRTVLDAHQLPFRDGSLRAVVMTDVIHHLPRVQSFFAEAARCVRPDGRIVMMEPWVTVWSRVIYRYLHPEPILADAQSWDFESTGPLSGANSALPWILFCRDREQFLAEFPEWRIRTIKPMMPFRYILSGGLSPVSLMPRATFSFWRRLEGSLEPWMGNLAMFALLVLERQ
jgi:SAM-dependent methyltransferase